MNTIDPLFAIVLAPLSRSATPAPTPMQALQRACIPDGSPCINESAHVFRRLRASNPGSARWQSRSCAGPNVAAAPKHCDTKALPRPTCESRDSRRLLSGPVHPLNRQNNTGAPSSERQTTRGPPPCIAKEDRGTPPFIAVATRDPPLYRQRYAGTPPAIQGPRRSMSVCPCALAAPQQKRSRHSTGRMSRLYHYCSQSSSRLYRLVVRCRGYGRCGVVL